MTCMALNILGGQLYIPEIAVSMTIVIQIVTFGTWELPRPIEMPIHTVSDITVYAFIWYYIGKVFNFQ